MCNVCDASNLVSRRELTFGWPGVPEQIQVELLEGTEPEWGRFRLRFARVAPDAPWTYATGDDLAGALGHLGTDVKWEFVPRRVKQWLREGGPPPMLGDELSAANKAIAEASARAWLSELSELWVAEGINLSNPVLVTNGEEVQLCWPREKKKGGRLGLRLIFNTTRFGSDEDPTVVVWLQEGKKDKRMRWPVKRPQEVLPWLRLRHKRELRYGRK